MSDTWGSLAPMAEDPLLPVPRNPAMPADLAQRGVMGVANMLGNIVMAPKRAMDQGMTTSEAIPWAGDVATMGVGAGAPAAVRGAAGIFGGRLAQTADQAALAQAEKMATAGIPREQIWNNTGWFKGGDDKWRFEIPDNAAAMQTNIQQPQHRLELAQDIFEGMGLPRLGFSNPKYREQTSKAIASADDQLKLMDATHQPLSAHMKHPELYGAYPNVAEIPTRRQDMFGYKGSYQPGEDPHLSYATMARPKETLSTVLHEGQHAVQDVEGFAKGSNTFGLRPGTPAWDIYMERRKALEQAPLSREVYSKAANYEGLAPEKDYKEYVKIVKKSSKDPNLDRMAQDYAVQTAYKRSAGEVEARNVQTRMNMTPEERRAKPPWLTEDVPADQQIFGALASGPQMSLPPKEPFRIQPQDVRAPKAANVNTSKAEVLADLPPPLPPSDRIWQNYVKRMGPDEMLKSEPVWSAAENLSAAKGISPSEAFAEVANDMFGRMGANRFMTPAQAKMHMARERGILVPVPAEQQIFGSLGPRGK